MRPLSSPSGTFRASNQGLRLPPGCGPCAWNLLRAEAQRFSREQANQQRLGSLYICELVQITSEEQVTDEMLFLERCLEQVPASTRQLLELKYQHDCPSEDIAQRFERSLAWVYTTLFRA